MDPRPAATVMVVRPGIEVLVERRAARSRFAPGFVVFPGGVVDDGDRTLAERLFADPGEAARACAIRELYEETGLLPTASGLQTLPERPPLADLALDPPPSRALVEVARWVAPEFLTFRFDAHFFVLAAQAGVDGIPDGVEIDHVWWARPGDVLDAGAGGEAPLMWPTLRMLEALEACAAVEEALDLRVQQVEPPVARQDPDGQPRSFRPIR